MVILSDYQLIENPKKGVIVRSGERNFCPCCNGPLKVIGSRRRTSINEAGEKIVLIIRRLYCGRCGKVHHELPDILVPYKRYGRECIETVLTGNATLTVSADESTLSRWRSWFQRLANHFLGCLISISIRYHQGSAGDPIRLPQSPFRRIWRFVGDAPGWLARIVRPVANLNLWIHTRSAFLS
jgi:hypothetical protein